MKIKEFFQVGKTDCEVIQFTEEHLKMAQEYEAKIEKLALMRTKNYTGLTEKGRYYTGFLGELAFKLYLEKYGINFIWNTNTSGQSDTGDFLINNKTFDVKTASSENYQYMMFPQAQMIHNRDYYVACKLCVNKVIIYGILSRKEIETLPVKDFANKGVLAKYKKLIEI